MTDIPISEKKSLAYLWHGLSRTIKDFSKKMEALRSFCLFLVLHLFFLISYQWVVHVSDTSALAFKKIDNLQGKDLLN